MIYSHEVETMCPIAQGVAHGAAPIPEEAKWVKARKSKIFRALHTVLAGVHLSRVHVSLHLMLKRALSRMLSLKLSAVPV